MAEYEKDFMLRQARQFADLLGSFMDKEAVDGTVRLDEEQVKKLQDEYQKKLSNSEQSER
ncbi:hypothetical protein ACYSNR_05250 [Enterococcus sp. LJL128]|uniref:hypothetical protein n=1 Tax=Enterococcus sp. LJL51 TaxID=3416656 RepID=UPI003CF855F1